MPASIESLIRQIESNPSDARGYCELAGAYRSAGEFRKAELTLLRASEVDPLHHETWVQLGFLYADLEEWQRSADVLEHACTLDPHDPAARVGLGMMRIAVQDVHGASEVCATLLEEFPDRSETHLLDGHVKKISGHSEAAAGSYRLALRIDPRQTEAMFNLVDLGPPDPTDPLTATLENLREDPTLSEGQSANVRFALARIYDAVDRTDESFDLFQEANAAASAALRRLGKTYVARDIEEEAQQLTEMFGRDTFVRQLEPLDLDCRLIFIVGMPRSGTTLAERILSAHSRVVTGGELPFMQDCLVKLRTARRSLRRRGSVDPGACCCSCGSTTLTGYSSGTWTASTSSTSFLPISRRLDWSGSCFLTRSSSAVLATQSTHVGRFIAPTSLSTCLTTIPWMTWLITTGYMRACWSIGMPCSRPRSST
jgi:Flp pilus assembly protein TadD